MFSSASSLSSGAGRGTFVSDHQAGRTFSRFNPMREEDGKPIRSVSQARESEGGRSGRHGADGAPGWPPTSKSCAFIAPGSTKSGALSPTSYFAFRICASRHCCAPSFHDELEELAQAWAVLVARAEAKVRTMPVVPAAAAALSLPCSALVLGMERQPSTPTTGLSS